MRSRTRILVVDDDATSRHLMRVMLESFSCEAIEASSAAEALQLVESESFDLILLDCHMPAMDGCELAATLRSRPETCAIKILGVTAASLPEQVAECHASGMDGVLIKPVPYRLLEAALHQHVPR